MLAHRGCVCEREGWGYHQDRWGRGSALRKRSGPLKTAHLRIGPDFPGGDGGGGGDQRGGRLHGVEDRVAPGARLPTQAFQKLSGRGPPIFTAG